MKVAETVKQRIDGYLELAEKIQKQYDADTIHDFRVASRNLTVIAPVISAETYKAWHGKITEWLKVLNRLRDLQVLKERTEDHKAIALLLQQQINDELQQWKEKSQEVAPEAFRQQLLQECSHTIQRIEMAPEKFDSVIRRHFRAVVDKLIERLDRLDISEPKSFHKLRIAYKSFRYMLTFLHDAGFLLELNREELKRWQELLGDIQDDEVAAAWLLEHRPEERDLIRSIQLHSAHQRGQFHHDKAQFRKFVIELL